MIFKKRRFSEKVGRRPMESFRRGDGQTFIQSSKFRGGSQKSREDFRYLGESLGRASRKAYSKLS